MVRTDKRQLYEIGARVAIPLEGRVGNITSFASDTGIYTLVFHDGHTKDVNDIEIESLVIKSPNQSNATSIETPSSIETSKIHEELVNSPISTSITSYDGITTILTGAIVSYMEDTGMYRAIYSNGCVQDMPLDLAKAQVLANRKRQYQHGDTMSSPLKKSKVHMEFTVPLNRQPFPSRTGAYVVIRKVLLSVVAQGGVQKMVSERQNNILKNDDVKPKRALEMFVEAGGLSVLQKVIVIWMRSEEKHAGVELILKVLCTLPGITPSLVIESGIGKTLRGIVRLFEASDHVAQKLADLAHYIIQMWKKTLLNSNTTISQSTISQIQKNTMNTMSGTTSVWVAKRSSDPSKRNAREQMTMRLHELRTTPIELKTASTMEHVEIFLPKYNSLGSDNARRPQRSIVLLDELAHRINRNNIDMVQSRSEDHLMEGQSSEIQISSQTIFTSEPDPEALGRRIKFGKSIVHKFHLDDTVIDLFATARSKALDKTMEKNENNNINSTNITPFQLPNKRTSPMKSILKKKSYEKPIDISFVKW